MYYVKLVRVIFLQILTILTTNVKTLSYRRNYVVYAPNKLFVGNLRFNIFRRVQYSQVARFI